MLVKVKATIIAMDPAIADGLGQEEATGTILVLLAGAKPELTFLDIKTAIQQTFYLKSSSLFTTHD